MIEKHRASSHGNDLFWAGLRRPQESRLSRIERDKHLYVDGGTGTGKSKSLENQGHQQLVEKQMRASSLLDLYGNLPHQLTRLDQPPGWSRGRNILDSNWLSKTIGATPTPDMAIPPIALGGT